MVSYILQESPVFPRYIFLVINPNYCRIQLSRPFVDSPESPVLFPPGEPLAICVHVSHRETETTTTKDHGHPLLNLAVGIADAFKTPPPSRDVERDVWFNCPPLEAGRSYSLRFQKGWYGRPGRNTLILKDLRTKRDVYKQNTRRLRVPNDRNATRRRSSGFS